MTSVARAASRTAASASSAVSGCSGRSRIVAMPPIATPSCSIGTTSIPKMHTSSNCWWNSRGQPLPEQLLGHVRDEQLVAREHGAHDRALVRRPHPEGRGDRAGEHGESLRVRLEARRVLDLVARLAQHGHHAEIAGGLGDAPAQVHDRLPDVEHRPVGHLHQLGFEVAGDRGRGLEVGGAEGASLGAEPLDRGIGHLVARADAHGDELATPYPAVRGLVVDAEPVRGFLQVHGRRSGRERLAAWSATTLPGRGGPGVRRHRAPMRSLTRELMRTGRPTEMTHASVESRRRTATRCIA